MLDKDKTDALDLLKRASAEINSLRNKNNLMSARLNMFDDCMQLLNSRVQSSNQGFSEDVAWGIDQFVRKQESAPTTNPE